MDNFWAQVAIAVVAGVILLFLGRAFELPARLWARKPGETEQGGGQSERRDKLREGLDQYSSKLSELSSRLAPNRIDTSPARVAQELDEVRNGLPDLDELQKIANGVRHGGLREKVGSGLESAKEWRFAIDYAWRQVEGLPGWTVDTRDRREEALYWFTIARYELHNKHEQYRSPILDAIAAIDSVERGEDLADPSDRLWRKALRRLGAYLTRLGTTS